MLEGGDGGWCMWVVLVGTNVEQKLSSCCAAGMRSCSSEGVYSCCIVGGGRWWGEGVGGDCSVVGSRDAWGIGIGGCRRCYGGCGSSSDVLTESPTRKINWKPWNMQNHVGQYKTILVNKISKGGQTGP